MRVYYDRDADVGIAFRVPGFQKKTALVAVHRGRN